MKRYQLEQAAPFYDKRKGYQLPFFSSLELETILLVFLTVAETTLLQKRAPLRMRFLVLQRENLGSIPDRVATYVIGWYAMDYAICMCINISVYNIIKPSQQKHHLRAPYFTTEPPTLQHIFIASDTRARVNDIFKMYYFV